MPRDLRKLLEVRGRTIYNMLGEEVGYFVIGSIRMDPNDEIRVVYELCIHGGGGMCYVFSRETEEAIQKRFIDWMKDSGCELIDPKLLNMR